jgi:hypothetical protein
MRRSIALAAFILALGAWTTAAQPPEPTALPGRPPHAGPAKRKLPALRAPTAETAGIDARTNANLRISFKIRYKELENSGNFIVQSGTQANYVIGGEEPREIQNAQGKGIEFKKHGIIVNVLPVLYPETDVVDTQLQCEISGPLSPVTSLQVPPIATFQLQIEFRSALGKPIVLVDEPDRRIEVKIDEVGL